ncbi:hypothetical protein ACIGO8_19055 [Streptomyces sp. NPDC053493]|uniref:hypothetical protein n=1 Tax=Streptomyces sp. NPDC053493 TaxID=3365705 RepID=UPI0037D4CBA3
MVLVLDDLHAVDAGSFQLLSHRARRAARPEALGELSPRCAVRNCPERIRAGGPWSCPAWPVLPQDNLLFALGPARAGEDGADGSGTWAYGSWSPSGSGGSGLRPGGEARAVHAAALRARGRTRAAELAAEVPYPAGARR